MNHLNLQSEGTWRKRSNILLRYVAVLKPDNMLSTLKLHLCYFEHQSERGFGRTSVYSGRARVCSFCWTVLENCHTLLSIQLQYQVNDNAAADETLSGGLHIVPNGKPRPPEPYQATSCGAAGDFTMTATGGAVRKDTSPTSSQVMLHLQHPAQPKSCPAKLSLTGQISDVVLRSSVEVEVWGVGGGGGLPPGGASPP